MKSNFAIAIYVHTYTELVYSMQTLCWNHACQRRLSVRPSVHTPWRRSVDCGRQTDERTDIQTDTSWRVCEKREREGKEEEEKLRFQGQAFHEVVVVLLLGGSCCCGRNSLKYKVYSKGGRERVGRTCYTYVVLVYIYGTHSQKIIKSCAAGGGKMGSSFLS